MSKKKSYMDTKNILSEGALKDFLLGLIKGKKGLKRDAVKLRNKLERNVNLVSFSDGHMEIAFNENLDKDFIKDLSNKLYNWTNKRWIISLSKKDGAISKKQEEQINKKKLFEDAKKSKVYKKVLETFPDAELIDIEAYEDKYEWFQ